jgi:hypothetical protein
MIITTRTRSIWRVLDLAQFGFQKYGGAVRAPEPSSGRFQTQAGRLTRQMLYADIILQLPRARTSLPVPVALAFLHFAD